ncbi:alkanesulfonate monooxygenase SsuD/methylene tetrahydromethanopterin reductase-like flavin-dependent oxidoreductase (luciferase family) [Pseudoclavibacter sp. JAI123]|uniref:LLM class flavin-dependent oxidoreductase n=1 Tax=Pseudoclavibacter sp. JAI123 TaxID=2723065 RepID=UPI0015C9B4D3|nr:LLM class flavin-dependent oxidoreductase [Pseudoclavibacter sp. JAI123]NYF12638.1 alkanesulfonate monooxygenase SsuD/methylene tetrahydromethanopterin reductase-like flavin-dependent oxidoreductase (luciferase family) [Pseudoclavibacter sp. JAI123]
MTDQKRRVHIAAQYNGEEPHEIWHPDLLPELNTAQSFTRAAELARDGLYDFYFQAETSSVGFDSDNRITEHDVVGRLDNVVTQSYLAEKFDNVGFVSTINTTNNNPYDLARRLHTLDALTGGRAGWNLVLGGSPTAHRNYRNIGDRSEIDRYSQGAETLAVVREYLRGPAGEAFSFSGKHFDVRAKRFGAANGGAPFVLLSGDSPRSRDFAAAQANGVYTHYANLEHGVGFTADIHRRAAAAGRDPSELRIFARAAVLVAETDAEASELQREVLPFQIHPVRLRRYLEQIWNLPLGDIDPDGPLPEIDPPAGAVAKLGLSIGLYLDGPAQAAVDRLRRIQAATGFGARQTLIAASGTDLIVGGASTVADKLISLVEARAVDGFVFTPHISGGWLADFNQLVIPILQERGVYPTEYRDETLTQRVLGS